MNSEWYISVYAQNTCLTEDTELPEYHSESCQLLLREIEAKVQGPYLYISILILFYAHLALPPQI